MGKIYDALKRAEKEAQINREKAPADDVVISKPSNEDSPIAKEYKDSYQDPQSKIAEPDQPTHLPKLQLISNAKISFKERGKRLSFLNFFIKKSDENKRLFTENLTIFNDLNPLVNEQYRFLRTRILAFFKEKNEKTILITSSLPAEGKSTVASNLAISIASGVNDHSLLVDCDLRRPTIHKHFNLPFGTGLSNYLREDIPLQQILRKTDVNKLSILSSGTHGDNSTELISSTKMIDLINELKSQYNDRYIIIDSPPIYNTPEPVILSKYVDGIILVVKAGLANREIVKRSIDLLDRNKIIGIVFNMSQEIIKPYHYYYSNKKK